MYNNLKTKKMKKIILSLILIITSFSAFSQLAIKKSQDTTNQSLRVVKKQIDTVIYANKGYVATLTFTATTSPGTYANLRTINSSTSTSANVNSFSISIPNGTYRVISMNAAVSSTAIGSFDVWLFSDAVLSEGDNRSVNGISTSDMMKNIGVCKMDGTWTAASSVQISNGKAGGYSSVNLPFLINVTGNKMNILVVARAAWTPSADSVYKLYFYLERMAN